MRTFIANFATRRYLALALALGVMALMWLPVMDPFPELELWYEDKWEHLSIYFLLTSTLYWALPRRFYGAWAVALAVAAYSLVLETGQIFLPFRGFEWFDLLANTTGCVLSWLVFRRVASRWKTA